MELFANYSRISEIFVLSYIILIISFSGLLYIFPLKNLPGKENHGEINAHSLYILLIKIRYSWILWKIFVNRNIIHQILIIMNRSNFRILATSNIALIIALSPGLEKNYTMERSSNSFPGKTCLSGFLENCPKSIPKSWCSPIQGTISNFLLNYGTDLSLCFNTF